MWTLLGAPHRVNSVERDVKGHPVAKAYFARSTLRTLFVAVAYFAKAYFAMSTKRE